MVYECEKCGAVLTAGARACPACGDPFEEVVPQDAEQPRRGWQAKSAEPNSAESNAGEPNNPRPAIDQNPRPFGASAAPDARPDADAGTSAQPHPARDSINSADRDYWRSKLLQANGAADRILAHRAFDHPFGQRLRRNPLRALAGLVLSVLVLIAFVWTHTNTYVFDQHPLYQANMASFEDVARSNTIDYVWPYEGHEDRLQAVYHTNSFGGDES